MFNFFKKKELKKDTTLNYDSIKVDMHSHVLPGIDDGAKTIQESIILIKKMMDLGIKKVIATPHIMADYYKNTAETIGVALDLLRSELKKQEIDLPVEAAAEHYFDETFEARIDDRKLMTMGDNYVLFEFSFLNRPLNDVAVIQKMIQLGYKPILAHPERYSYMNMEQLTGLHNMGCNLQLNTISLTGYYGKDVRKKAEDIINNQLVDFISSDMHHVRHAEALRNALAMPYVAALLNGEYPLKNVLFA
jgi:protein-tyrosine phosphatase